jgi:DNA polymerase (family 10)
VDNTNRDSARTIFAIAALLESQGANPYRVRAYRRAAIGLLRLPEQAERYTNPSGELELPWLGPRLRRKLGELVRHGRMQFHDNLLAELPRPLRELLSVPGIGPKTAERLIGELGIRGLRSLARAARQGRLRKLRGIGPTRERQLGAAAEHLLAQAA